MDYRPELAAQRGMHLGVKQTAEIYAHLASLVAYERAAFEQRREMALFYARFYFGSER